MNEQNNSVIDEFNNIMSNNNDISNSQQVSYNRAKVNLNVSLSNPSLKVNDSMSVNIKNNNISQNNNQYNNSQYNNSFNSNNLNDNYEDIKINEKKDLNDSNLGYNNTLIEKANFNNSKQIFSKSYNLNNKELKIILLITLLVFIIIMFFPSISQFFFDLFNN